MTGDASLLEPLEPLARGWAGRDCRRFEDPGAVAKFSVNGSIALGEPGRVRITNAHSIGGTQRVFASLKEFFAKAAPPRAGDRLAGNATATAEENIAAKLARADVPVKATLSEPLILYEDDDVTRLILDRHEAIARRDSAVSWPTPNFTDEIT